VFRKLVIPNAIVVILMLAGPRAVAGSEEHEDYDAYKLRLSLFWFYSKPSGSFTGESHNGMFDLQKDVGFNSYSTFFGKLDWKFTRKNHLLLSATDFNQSKTFTLNRTITFRGQTFALNSVASSGLRTRFLAPGYQYDIMRRKKWNLGALVQLYIFDATGFLNAAAQVNNGVPQSAVFSSSRIRVPLPVAGPELRFYATKRLFVTANVLGMYFFGYGDFISTQGAVGFKLTKNIAARGGYQIGSRFNVNTKSNQVGLNLTQKGALAGLEFSF
jgi:hypothetical protein